MPIDTRESAPSRGRGRPRGFDAEEVLDGALDLFWRRGYRATTTRELESALGVRQSSLYNVFGSKEDLMEAALDRYEVLTARALLRPLEGSAAGLEALKEFFARLGHWVTHDGRQGCMLINMTVEEGGASPRLVERSRAYRRRVRDALREGLARAAALAETSSSDLDARADLLLGLVLGLNVVARGRASDTEVERLIRSVQSQLESWRLPARI